VTGFGALCRVLIKKLMNVDRVKSVRLPAEFAGNFNLSLLFDKREGIFFPKRPDHAAHAVT
jgi:hypothetical protein